MRLLPLLVVTCALCQTATAQTSDCKAIADSATRLACYDRSIPAAAPTAAARSVAHAAPAPKTDNSKYIDSISAEDAIMNERIKGICRGC